MVQFVSLFSQERKSVPDTNLVSQDTLVSDTIKRNLKKISPEAIDKQVTYKSAGRKKNDLVNKRAILIDQAEVTYACKYGLCDWNNRHYREGQGQACI
jgi:hypothetical protein